MQSCFHEWAIHECLPSKEISKRKYILDKSKRCYYQVVKDSVIASTCFIVFLLMFPSIKMQWKDFWRKRPRSDGFVQLVHLFFFLIVLQFPSAKHTRIYPNDSFLKQVYRKLIKVFEWVIQECVIFSHYYSFLCVWIPAGLERANAKQEQEWFLLRCLQNKQSLDFNWNLIHSPVWIHQMIPVED